MPTRLNFSIYNTSTTPDWFANIFHQNRSQSAHFDINKERYSKPQLYNICNDKPKREH